MSNFSQEHRGEEPEKGEKEEEEGIGDLHRHLCCWILSSQWGCFLVASILLLVWLRITVTLMDCRNWCQMKWKKTKTKSDRTNFQIEWESGAQCKRKIWDADNNFGSSQSPRLIHVPIVRCATYKYRCRTGASRL